MQFFWRFHKFETEHRFLVSFLSAMRKEHKYDCWLESKHPMTFPCTVLWTTLGSVRSAGIVQEKVCRVKSCLDLYGVLVYNTVRTDVMVETIFSVRKECDRDHKSESMYQRTRLNRISYWILGSLQSPRWENYGMQTELWYTCIINDAGEFTLHSGSIDYVVLLRRTFRVRSYFYGSARTKCQYWISNKNSTEIIKIILGTMVATIKGTIYKTKNRTNMPNSRNVIYCSRRSFVAM